MNHKYSTYAIVFILFIFGIGIAMGFLESSDLDDVCSVDNSIFYRSSGTWACGNLTDMTVNVTVNNITNLMTNWSIHSNYWDNLDTPYDITHLGNVSLQSANSDFFIGGAFIGSSLSIDNGAFTVDGNRVNSNLGTTNFTTATTTYGVQKVYNDSRVEGSICANFGDSSCVSDFPVSITSRGASDYALALYEVSGGEYQTLRVNRYGDVNWYSDSNSIRISSLDAVQRVGIGTISAGSTLSVYGNCAVGTSYATSSASTNGCIIQGLSSFGHQSPRSYVHTRSLGTEIIRYPAGYVNARDTDHTIIVNATNNDVYVNLPTCSDKYSTGTEYSIKASAINNGTYRVILKPTVSNLIDNQHNASLTNPQESVKIQCDGLGQWVILSHFEGGYLI